MSYGLHGSVMYAFVPDPSAMTGLVPALGFDPGVSIYPGRKDAWSGVTALYRKITMEILLKI